MLVVKDSPFVSVEEACSILKICRQTLYRRIKDGDLPEPMKVGRRSLFSTAEIREHMEGVK